MPNRFLRLFLGDHCLFIDIHGTFGTHLDALAAMGAAFLPDTVWREPGFVGLFFLTFDREILAHRGTLVAHGAARWIDVIGDEFCAFVDGADSLYMPFKKRGMLAQECGQDVGVVLALLAHAAVLHINSDPPEQRDMLFISLAGLDHLKDLDRIVNTKLAGMTFGAHAVLGIIVVEFFQLDPRQVDRTLTFQL